MNNELKLDLMEIANNGKSNSLKPRKTEVKGESYKSRDVTKRKNIETARNAFLGVAALVVMGIGINAYGNFSEAGEIRQEVNTTYTEQNLMGGQYHEVSKYDEGFVDYANDLGYFGLKELYDETKDSMELTPLDVEIENVVEKMEDNYLEEKGRGR